MTALLKHILAAGPGPALFGLGATILTFLIAAKITGRLHLLRQRPALSLTLLAGLYITAMSAATKPPVDPPEEPEEIFEARVWIDADGKIILIDTPLKEIIP